MKTQKKLPVWPIVLLSAVLVMALAVVSVLIAILLIWPQEIEEALGTIADRLAGAVEEPYEPPVTGESAQLNEDAGRYMAEIQRSIKKRWKPPRETEDQRVTLFFEVTPDGQLGKVEVQQSSGNPAVDEAALKALRDSTPFPPVPESLQGKGEDPNLDIQFTFDYTVHRKNEGTG